MKNIFIFDSRIQNSTQFKKRMAEVDLDYTITSSPARAVRYLKENRYSLTVIDICDILARTGMESTELSALIPEDTPVILIYNRDNGDEILQICFKYDDLIFRPYTPSELLYRIRKSLRGIKRTPEEEREESIQIKTLYEVASIPLKTLKMEEMSRKTLELINKTFECESSAIFLKDAHDQINLVDYRGNVNDWDIKFLVHFLSDNMKTNVNHYKIEDLSNTSFWRLFNWRNPSALKNTLCFYLRHKKETYGYCQLFNVSEEWMNSMNKQKSSYMEKFFRHVSGIVYLINDFIEMNQGLYLAEEELAILYEVSNALSSTLNLEELLKLIVRKARKNFRARVASLMLIDNKTRELTIRFAEGLSREIQESARLRIGEGIAGKVAESGEPQLLVDLVGFNSVDMVDNIKSAMSVPLKIQDAVIGVLNVSKTSRYRFTEADLQILTNLASLAAQAIEKAALYEDLKTSLEEIKISYLNLVCVLSNAIEAKDPYTGGHVERVAKYGIAIANEMDPEISMDESFRYALLLHDVGKIEIPDEILTKPGRLNNEEWAIMKRHPEAGARLLAPVRSMEKVLETVRYHQERFDGTGYPMGMKGEEIPLHARIVAVADAFDAMISARPYREAKTIEFARTEILNNRGTQFDPTVVDAFLRALEKGAIA